MSGSTVTDDDYPITHSPLERKITRDGITVEICIYRGNDDSDWILEIVDESGGSTIWDDLASDQEALDLAIKTIDEEGIEAFAAETKNSIEDPPLFLAPLPFEDDELSELTTFLGDRSLASTVGMLAAVVSVPEVLPSQLWLGELMKGVEFKDTQQVQRFADLIMRLNNYVAAAFVEDDVMRICLNDEHPDSSRSEAEFCTSYLSIIGAAGIAATGNDLLELIGRIAQGEERAWGMTHDFDAVLGSLYGEWHPRAIRRKGPKVGRNDPCTCGSGKKFKKCHGATA